MTVHALPNVSCTIQPHPHGGYTPTLHLRGNRAPEPVTHEPHFGSLTDAIRFARHEYGVRNVMVPPPSTGEAA